MFDPGIIHRLEGENIDRTYNAITLSAGFHQSFGDLQVYFEAVPNFEHTYVIKCTKEYAFFRPSLPITRQLFITPERTIDPPSANLLAIHRACCLIVHMSAAGKYIEKVLRDMEQTAAKSDGTTELGTLVNLRLNFQTRVF